MQQEIDYKATYEFSKVVLCQYFEPYEKGWLLKYVSDKSKWEVTDTSGTFRGYIYEPVFIEYLNAGQIRKVTPPSEAEGQGSLTDAQDEYIALLTREIDDLVGVASVHGWRSNNHEAGSKLRERIAALKSHPALSGPVEGPWKLKGHSHQIADTGDYSGYYELTDGKISIMTSYDDDDALQPIIDALNASGCKFYLDDSLQFENDQLTQQIAHLKSQQAGPRWVEADQLDPKPTGLVFYKFDNKKDLSTAGRGFFEKSQFDGGEYGFIEEDYQYLEILIDSPAPEQVDPQLITVYREYIQLLSDEISELSGLASIHGWKSKRAEMGEYYREMITKLQTKQP